MTVNLESPRALIGWPSRHPARAGAMAGWFQQACGMAVALMLVPIVTRFLPSAQSGIWFSFQSLVMMIALLDLGFGFAISRQAAFTLGATEGTKAKDDFIHLPHGWHGVRQLFHLTQSLYLWLAAAGVVFGLAAFELFNSVGHLIPEGIPGVRGCWYWMVLATSVLISTAGDAAFLNGLGAVYQTRFLGGLYQLIAGLGAAVAASRGWGLPAMGASYAIGAVLYRAGIWVVLRLTATPMWSVEFAPAPRGSLVSLARAALPVGGVNVFGSLVYTVQTPLLGMLLGPEKVAPFYLAQKISMALNMGAMQTILPKLPFFTKCIGARDFTAARNIMLTTIRHASFLVLLASSGFFLLSPWIAEVLLKKIAFIDTSTRALMTIDLALLGCSVIWGHFVLASGRNPFVVSTIMTGVVSLAATVLLVPVLGVPALPLATIAAGLIFNTRLNFIEGIRTLRRIST